jgi:hypothetical protein
MKRSRIKIGWHAFCCFQIEFFQDLAVDVMIPISTHQVGSYSDSRHSEIVDRLNDSKSAGLISDYFVSWTGRDGNLEPIIRAWKRPEAIEEKIRVCLSQALAGLVSPTNLRIVDES